ncbi:MAG: hypothetical protein AAGI46_02800 [Planctomycetota bacterium]
MQSMPVFQPRGTHPPMSNTERQRQFRERNPGYYGRLHRKRKAERLARLAAKAAQEQGLETVVMRKSQLCLPAPDPIRDQERHGLLAGLARLAAEREKDALL